MDGTCATCGKVKQLTKGECATCYKYRLRTGQARSAHLFRANKTHCQNCERRNVLAKGLCPACLKYQNKHGKPRPRHLWVSVPKCRNCSKPEGIHATSGLCDRCHKYYKLTGDMMPQKYWKEAHWCDCGKQAHFKVALKVQKTTEDYWLCDECYAIEMS